MEGLRMNRQSQKTSRQLLSWGLLGVLLLGSLPAQAALGGDPEPAAADQKHTYARMQVVQNPGYTVHELDAGTGTVVREYLGPDGKVFGVSWRGQFRPNLRELLGASYETFLAAPRPKVARGPINLSLPGLFLHMSGRQRAFYGRAFLPDRVPQGLSTEEIR
jgi:hypothetical protein